LHEPNQKGITVDFGKEIKKNGDGQIRMSGDLRAIAWKDDNDDKSFKKSTFQDRYKTLMQK
jgi:hypothetical protein